MSAEHRAHEPRPFVPAKGRCFIDTHVLIYAHASDEPLKQSRALSLLGLLQVQAQLHQQHRLSFYDAMIVSAAHVSHCSTLYSEDFNAGEVLRGVKLINPFAQLS